MTLESRTLDRSVLEGKVLAELQTIAGSLGISGHQRLRKGELIQAIVDAASADGQVGTDAPTVTAEEPAAGETATPRARRTGRTEMASGDDVGRVEATEEPAAGNGATTTAEDTSERAADTETTPAESGVGEKTEGDGSGDRRGVFPCSLRFP